MDIYYNTKSMKEELTKQIERRMAIMTAWQNVTFPTKKDGTRFSVLSKNIEGAKLEKHSYSIVPGALEITVYTHCNAYGYINDSLSCYIQTKYIPATDPRRMKTQNIKKIYPMEEMYFYDIDDIQQAIKTRVEYLKKQISDTKKQIAATDKAYNQFKKDYENAVAKLHKLSVFENGNTELKSMILNSIQKNY